MAPSPAGAFFASYLYSKRPPMVPTIRQLTLPIEKFRLEETNMPETLAAALAGQNVAVEVLPKGQPGHGASTWTTLQQWACRCSSTTTARHGTTVGASVYSTLTRKGGSRCCPVGEDNFLGKPHELLKHERNLPAGFSLMSRRWPPRLTLAVQITMSRRRCMFSGDPA